VLAFRFPLPSLAVQEATLCEVRANDEPASRFSSALRRQIDLLAEGMQALITAAVTGQFDVTTARAVA
jgi:type I restriction enzyme S subunit